MGDPETKRVRLLKWEKRAGKRFRLDLAARAWLKGHLARKMGKSAKTN